MKLAELMHGPPVTCRTTATIGEAAELMATRNVGSVLVLDRSDHLTGIATDRDLAVRGYAQGLSGDVHITEVMTRNVASAVPYADAEYAATLMVQRGVRRLPVVDDDGRVHGVISLDDLVRHLADAADALADMLEVQGPRAAEPAA